jgi:alpha-galactosidase
VEVPALASPKGVEAIKVGDIPKQLAGLISPNALAEEMAVEAALEGDPRKVYQAVLLDPLTSAVLGMEEIKEMVNKMFLQNRDYLPQFRSLE